MNFYESIAKYYEYIFPYNPLHKEFILQACNKQENKSLLDIGCATGELCIQLNNNFESITGIDLDEGMLNSAKQKDYPKGKIKLIPMNMLHIQRELPDSKFHIISCFGNTLVHLGTEKDILNFFQQAKAILKPDGKLLFQIINYDRIIDQNISGLATIENDTIRFERNYHNHDNLKFVDFETILTIKETDKSIKNSIPLLAIRKESIHKLLLQSGFKNIQYYGSFKRDTFHENSIPLIVEAS